MNRALLLAALFVPAVAFAQSGGIAVNPAQVPTATLTTPGVVPNLGGVGGALATNNSLSELAPNPAPARINLGLGTASTYAVGTTGAVVPVLNMSNTFGGTQAFNGTTATTGQITTATINHLVLNGPLTGSAAPSALNTYQYAANAMSGTLGAGLAYSPLYLSLNDTINANAAIGVDLDQKFMTPSAGFAGNRNLLSYVLSIAGAPAVSDTSAHNYQNGTFVTNAGANVGGTSTSSASGAVGSVEGLNPNCYFLSGATNFIGQYCMEIDNALYAGSSAARKVGILHVLTALDAVQGAETDAADLYSRAGVNGPGWRRIMQVGSEWARSPLDPANGVAMMAQPNILASYAAPSHQLRGRAWIDATADNPSQAFAMSLGFTVDPRGNVAAQTETLGGVTALTPGANGLSITPTGNSVATTAAVSSGGSNNIAMDVVSASGGIYQIATAAASNVSVNAIGSGGTPGSCTLTGTTGTGTPFQATATVAAGGSLTAAASLSIAVPGSYSVSPTDPQNEPVTTNCGLSGATVNVQSTALTIATLVAASGTAKPATAVSTNLTHGSSTGPTLAFTWASAPANDVVVGAATAVSAAATTGFMGVPFTTSAPTGTPINQTNPMCSINTTSRVLNCNIPGAGLYHVSMTAGAG